MKPIKRILAFLPQVVDAPGKNAAIRSITRTAQIITTDMCTGIFVI